MSSSAGDTYLIEQVRAGESAAWRKLVDRYQGRLVQFARRRLNDANAAEDIAQETLIGFLEALPNYDASRSIETFLFAIARHKLIDHLRRLGRRGAVEAVMTESFADAQAVERAPSPSSWLLSKERGQREQRALVHVLRGFVADLQRQRKFLDLKVIELIFCAGKRNKEIAKLVGVDEKAVAGIKFRALDKMRDWARDADPHHTLFPGLWHG